MCTHHLQRHAINANFGICRSTSNAGSRKSTVSNVPVKSSCTHSLWLLFCKMNPFKLYVGKRLGMSAQSLYCFAHICYTATVAMMLFILITHTMCSHTKFRSPMHAHCESYVADTIEADLHLHRLDQNCCFNKSVKLHVCALPI